MKYFISITLALLFSFDAQTQTAQDYAVEPSIQAASLSPDGDVLALAVAQNDQKNITLITLDGIEATSAKTIGVDFTRNSREEILWIGWAGEDTLLSYVRFIDKGHKGRPIGTARLVSVSKDGEDFKDLGALRGLNLRGNRERTNGTGLISLLPNDPEKVLIGVGWDGASTVNVKTGHAKLIRRGTRKTQSFTPDLQGNIRIAQGREIEAGRYHLSIRDSDTNSWRDYSKYIGLNSDERIVGFMKDPNDLVIARYGALGTLEFQVYNLKQQKVIKTLFSDPKYDADSLVYDSTFSNVIGVEYIADSPQTRLFDETTQQAIDQISSKFPEYNLTLLSETSSSRKVVVRASSPTRPGIIILYDTETGESKTISSDYPNLRNTPQGRVKPIEYTAADGTLISGYMTLPPKVTAQSNAKNLPFIILPHGGPYARIYADYDWLAQYLASRGYGVLQMNFRGSEGYGEAFMKAGRDDWSLMRSDVNDGATWLFDEGFANPDRLCIMGWSFGGYIAQMAASESSELYNCSLSVNGVSDWTQMKIPDDPEFWGELNKELSKKQDASPYFKVEHVKMPLYLAHAKLDTRVPYTQFKRYASKLKKKKIPFEGHSFELEDHDIAGSENRTELLETITVFLETHIGPSEWAND